MTKKFFVNIENTLKKSSEKISFVGRLGTYRYLDMDQIIAEALTSSREFLKCLHEKKEIPKFFNNEA